MDELEKSQEQDDFLTAMDLLNKSFRIITELLKEETRRIHEMVELQKEVDRLKDPFLSLQRLSNLAEEELNRRREEEEKGE